MRARALIGSAVAAAALALPAVASAGGTENVTIQQSAFGPPQVAALIGDTVTWHNGSLRDHTVTTADGSFGSNGHIVPGASYSAVFNSAGVHPYYCMLHAGMTGEVDVFPVLLSGPAAAVAPGQPISLDGRAGPGTSTVQIQQDTGAGFVPVAVAAVDGSGAFHATVVSAASARYRAVSLAGESQSVQVVVVNRRIGLKIARVGRTRLARAVVTPATPGSVVVLQVWLRERFGWFTVSVRRLDRHSQADFPLRHPGRRARALLVLPDGYTPVATSAPLRLPRR